MNVFNLRQWLFALNVNSYTLKKCWIKNNPTKHWVNIGQNTCWDILTQLVGLNVFTKHAGLFYLSHLLFKTT